MAEIRQQWAVYVETLAVVVKLELTFGTCPPCMPGNIVFSFLVIRGVYTTYNKGCIMNVAVLSLSCLVR